MTKLSEAFAKAAEPKALVYKKNRVPLKTYFQVSGIKAESMARKKRQATLKIILGSRIFPRSPKNYSFSPP
jgi:hypothetical protein